MLEQRKTFLHNEILLLTLSGALARNPVYRKTSTPNEREDFRKYVKKWLIKKCSEEYMNKSESIDKDQHKRHLEEFKKDIELNYKHVLRNNIITFGTVQKLLNLYLKYMWCLDENMPTPPHCPVDRKILHKAKIHDINWTQMDKPQYEYAIEKISQISKIEGISIAEWELVNFKRV